MRRIANSATGSLPTATLYRQDIEEIVQIIRGGKPDAELSIVSGNFSYDSLDELKLERGDVVHHLKVDARPGGRLEIAPKHVDMSGLSATDEGRIAGILRQQKRPFGGVQELVGWIISFGGWTVLIAVLINLQLVGVTAARLLLTLPPILFFCVAFTFLPPRSRVFLVRRHEHMTFWRRHAGEFVKAGLTLGGGALGYYIRVIQERYFSP
jgi:hypothetical protein